MPCEIISEFYMWRKLYIPSHPPPCNHVCVLTFGCLIVCAGDGSAGRDPGRHHGGRVLPPPAGRRTVCPPVDLLHHGGNQQLRDITGTDTHFLPGVSSAIIARHLIRQDIEADGSQMVYVSSVAKCLMYLDSCGASLGFSDILTLCTCCQKRCSKHLICN